MKLNLVLFFILFISCKDNRPLNGFWTTDEEDSEYISGILIKDSMFIYGYPSMNHNYVIKNLTDSSFVLYYPACHCADSAIVNYKIKDEELDFNFRCDTNSSMQYRNIFGLYKPSVLPEPYYTSSSKKLSITQTTLSNSELHLSFFASSNTSDEKYCRALLLYLY